MVEVAFHDIGEGMTEGEILRYLVQIGDEVVTDQPLIEVQTDKMVAEIPSPAAGKVATIHREPGSVVPVGTILLELEPLASQTLQNLTPGQEQLQARFNKQEDHQEMAGPFRMIATPSVRRYASQKGVSLQRIPGSGPNKRILRKDVDMYLRGHVIPERKSMEQQAVATEDHMLPLTAENRFETEEYIPYCKEQQLRGNTICQAVSTIPHVTHFDDIDVTNLVGLQIELEKGGQHIDLIAFFIRAVAIALQDYRIFHARLDEENAVIQLWRNYHIGLVNTNHKEEIISVIADADQKSITTLHKEQTQSLDKAYSARKQTGASLHGCFIIRMDAGGSAITPIIPKGQAAYLVLHQRKKKPVVMPGDKLGIRYVQQLSFSFDHRIADGAQAIGFTNRLAELLQNPAAFILP